MQEASAHACFPGRPVSHRMLYAVAGDFNRILVGCPLHIICARHVERRIEGSKLYSTVTTGPGIDEVTVGIDEDRCAACVIFLASGFEE